MNPTLRAYLETIGLRAGVSDDDAKAFHEKLTGTQLARADVLKEDERGLADFPPVTPPADPPATPPADDDRGDSPADDTNQTNEAAIREAVAKAVLGERQQERQRVRQIHELAGDDTRKELRDQALVEGWTVERATAAFLKDLRDRQSGVGPAIHVRDHATDCNVRSLAAGMLMGQGLDPTKQRLHNGQGSPRRVDALTEQDADRGEDLCALSAIDLVRECAMIDTGRYHRDPTEAMRAATSGATLSYVFTTNVYAKLLAGWETIGDTTVGWCDETDEPNFLQQEDISLQANARLQKLPPGDTAKHATASDTRETYKIARYAKQFVVDEQDIINDRLSAITRMPGEMGEAARDMRPELVYSLMLQNPTLVADSGAVFNATAVTTAGGHANLGTVALSSDGLKAAITAMVKQRLNRTTTNPGRALLIRPKFLIVPAELEWTARALTASAALAKMFADTSDPWYSQLNLIAQEGIRVVVDDRIGAIGVMDPASEAVRTGLDTNWFLAAGGTKSIRVAYRRGTNRRPLLRSFVLDRGQWGVGWDINLDIGAAFMDYRVWYKSTGGG
ncbi:hypothetical protein LCGC14_2137710 [marine sediment metagenome]|uniref:Bacteriophage Mu GpT domain-containing protein n=1 Tax=marine sediment metagenome TaxID=412755 RepID=A0A0F9ELJ2_9ZZZZ